MQPGGAAHQPRAMSTARGSRFVPKPHTRDVADHTHRKFGTSHREKPQLKA